MEKFNHNLITKTIKYFKERYDLDISKETAEIYLDSLSNLYITIAKL